MRGPARFEPRIRLREKLLNRARRRAMMTDHAIDFQPVEMASPIGSDAGPFSWYHCGPESQIEINLWEHRHA